MVFVLEPSSTTTETISIGARKEKHRDIVIRYTFIDKQQDVADFRKYFRHLAKTNKR